MHELTAEKRNETGTTQVQELRDAGYIPGVVYGKKEKSTPIKLNAHDFGKVLKDAGETSIIQLKGLGDDLDVLIHEVDYEPVRGAPRHVDLYAIERGKKLSVSIPLEFVGDSKAVKDLGGVLVKVMHEIEIEVLPRDLPQQLEVDLSKLTDFDAQIQVKDIPLPESAEAIPEPEEVVALVNEAVEEEFDEEPEEVDMDAIEVEERGKEEEAGDSEESEEKE